MRIANGGLLSIGSGRTLNIWETGQVKLDGGGIHAGTQPFTNMGMLRGSGVVNGSVNNAGTIRPGVAGSGGVIAIASNYTQSSAGTLHVPVLGQTSGTRPHAPPATSVTPREQ